MHTHGAKLGLAILGILVAALAGRAAFLEPKSNGPTPLAHPSPFNRPTDVTHKVTFIGDSYTASVGAPGRGWVERISARFGWATYVNAQGGTGYINDGHRAGAGHAPFKSRLVDLDLRWPDMIIVAGGIGDEGYPPNEVEQAASSTLLAIRRAARPTTKLVVIGPWPYTEFNSAEMRRTDLAIRAAASNADATYLSPMSERWFRPSDIRKYIGPDGVHPNASGYEVLASRLTTDLARTVPSMVRPSE